MTYSVCIPAVLRGKNVKEALEAVRAAGYNHYEFWGWWGQDMDAYKEAQEKQQLSPAALCTKMIPLTDAVRRQEYLEGLKETVEVCHKLGCKTIISQVGSELEGVSRQEPHAGIVEGLRMCVPILEENDLTLVIEPLNTRIDHKGYYLWSSEEAFQIVDEVGSRYVKVLFDLYHQYVMEDLSIERIVHNIDKIGHFHMAGYPGRHEPLIDSEIDYPSILKAIEQSGYQGAVGLEYMPVQDAEAGLKVLCGQLCSFHA